VRERRGGLRQRTAINARVAAARDETRANTRAATLWGKKKYKIPGVPDLGAKCQRSPSPD
jgi:hypothetical protein